MQKSSKIAIKISRFAKNQPPFYYKNPPIKSITIITPKGHFKKIDGTGSSSCSGIDTDSFKRLHEFIKAQLVKNVSLIDAMTMLLDEKTLSKLWPNWQ
jgi:hypothetical protein